MSWSPGRLPSTDLARALGVAPAAVRAYPRRGCPHQGRGAGLTFQLEEVHAWLAGDALGSLGPRERHLAAADPVMAGLVARHGPCPLKPRRRAPFPALVASICAQMVSDAAARTVYGRLEAILGEVTPAAVAARRPARLRGAGLSATKAGAIHELARRIEAGDLDLVRLRRADDAEVYAALTDVRGIGDWTAQMFLMFQLGRPDVFPARDLGVQEGLRRAYALARRPGPAEAAALAARWAPHRSAGAWYCWRALEGSR